MALSVVLLDHPFPSSFLRGTWSTPHIGQSALNDPNAPSPHQAPP